MKVEDTQKPPAHSDAPTAQGSARLESQGFVTKESLDQVTGTILGALNPGFGEIKRVQLQQQEHIRTLDENVRVEASTRHQQMFDLENKFEALQMKARDQEPVQSTDAERRGAAADAPFPQRSVGVIPDDPYPIPGHDDTPW